MPNVPSFQKRAKSVSNGEKRTASGNRGLGNCRCRVVSLLQENAECLRCAPVSHQDRRRVRTGQEARSRVKAEGITCMMILFPLRPPDIDVVLELIGGAEGAARALVEASLTHGRAVVTANKALIAIHGAHLSHLAATHGASLLLKASVAGGIRRSSLSGRDSPLTRWRKSAEFLTEV